eukprot:CAMPEP_0113925178 /NCGR_PEP_ID=MMETSP1159-20121227/3060_1 /TAXON_ID=88271 /ORGANISM="Picocystis salinarum" /LENGTH=138 /DNA_ID=CAMNT_0000925441 /DNA_START=187 /DNA_END=603 /DNA_ORIENTATION=+ /assembly_acc=CAM_ASM_000767
MPINAHDPCGKEGLALFTHSGHCTAIDDYCSCWRNAQNPPLGLAKRPRLGEEKCTHFCPSNSISNSFGFACIAHDYFHARSGSNGCRGDFCFHASGAPSTATASNSNGLDVHVVFVAFFVTVGIVMANFDTRLRLCRT